MKQSAIWDKLWKVFLVFLGLMFLIPFLTTAYWMIFGFPETPFPVYLNKDVGKESFSVPLSVGEVWEEDDFTVRLSDVQFGEAGENGMRLCELTVQIKNENMVTCKNSRKLLGFVHFNRDSEHAYRQAAGYTEKWKTEYTTKPEKPVKDIMEVYLGMSIQVKENTWHTPKESEPAQLLVPKGAEAVYRYQIMIPEEWITMEPYFQIFVDKNKNEQYMKEYELKTEEFESIKNATEID